MTRFRPALRFAVLALAVALFVEPGPVGNPGREWLAAASQSSPPEIIAAVETTAPASAMDAALVLRATQRFSPAGYVFLDPLANLDGLPVLISKLGDTKPPVTFTVDGKVPALPAPAKLAPPLTTTISGAVNPLAARFVQRITLDRLMIRAERSDRGEISLDLDNLFRGRLIAVETAGERGAVLLAAQRNGLVQRPTPLFVTYAAALLVASLPWWPGRRSARVLGAIAVTGLWLLLALGIFRQFAIAAPLLPALMLPLLAWIPRASDKTQ